MTRQTHIFLILVSVCGALAIRGQAIETKKSPVRLAWYSSLRTPTARQLTVEFAKRHPGIEVDLAHPESLFERNDQQEAHWRKADVVTDTGLEQRTDLIGAGAFTRLDFPAERSPALCPWVLGKSGCSVYTHTASMPIIFQRTTLSEQDAPDSLAALAQPRWRGKVALLAPSDSFSSDCLYRFIVNSPVLGLAWLERMRDNDVMLLLSPQALWEAELRGVRPVSWGVVTDVSVPQQQPARTIALLAREGSPLVLYSTAINSRAPHPAGARLFVQWLLDPATREYLAKNDMSQSLLKGTCEKLERGQMCGRSPKAEPSVSAQLSRKVWKALLGDSHDSR